MAGETDPEARRRASNAEHWRRREAERVRMEADRKRREADRQRGVELDDELQALQAERERFSRQTEKGGELDRAERRTLGWWALGWVLLTGLWFVAVFFVERSGVMNLNANGGIAALPIVLLPILGWIPPLIGMTRRRSAVFKADKRTRSRILEIKGELDRLSPRRRRQDSGSTVRQAQHAWYGTHSELNWQHREQGQALGFDNAHDYVNNFLESE